MVAVDKAGAGVGAPGRAWARWTMSGTPCRSLDVCCCGCCCCCCITCSWLQQLLLVLVLHLPLVLVLLLLAHVACSWGDGRGGDATLMMDVTGRNRRIKPCSARSARAPN
jgi:hypothetical protein